jgi:hypothetical protein
MFASYSSSGGTSASSPSCAGAKASVFTRIRSAKGRYLLTSMTIRIGFDSVAEIIYHLTDRKVPFAEQGLTYNFA